MMICCPSQKLILSEIIDKFQHACQAGFMIKILKNFAVSAVLSGGAKTQAVKLPRCRPEDAADLTSFTLWLFHALCEKFPDNFLVVFDNYHALTEDSVIHDIIIVGLQEHFIFLHGRIYP